MRRLWQRIRNFARTAGRSGRGLIESLWPDLSESQQITRAIIGGVVIIWFLGLVPFMLLGLLGPYLGVWFALALIYIGLFVRQASTENPTAVGILPFDTPPGRAVAEGVFVYTPWDTRLLMAYGQHRVDFHTDVVTNPETDGFDMRVHSTLLYYIDLNPGRWYDLFYKNGGYEETDERVDSLCDENFRIFAATEEYETLFGMEEHLTKKILARLFGKREEDLTPEELDGETLLPDRYGLGIRVKMFIVLQVEAIGELAELKTLRGKERIQRDTELFEQETINRRTEMIVEASRGSITRDQAMTLAINATLVSEEKGQLNWIVGLQDLGLGAIAEAITNRLGR